jgi:hypothetical protein
MSLVWSPVDCKRSKRMDRIAERATPEGQCSLDSCIYYQLHNHQLSHPHNMQKSAFR